MLENIEALKNIPSELKFNGSWCGWKYIDNKKLPFNVTTGALAKSNDQSTFCSFPVLLKYIKNYWEIDESGKFLKGIGIGVFNNFSAIDIDHCVEDGIVNDFAQEIIEKINSYTEISPSGHGIRIIFKTNKKYSKDQYYINNAKIGLEVYISNATSKFLTITGRTLNINNKIENVDIDDIMNKYMLKSPTMHVSNSIVPKISLNEALSKDRKLNELYNEQAPGSGANESELDAALCCKLAYWLEGNFGSIELAFEQSPYFASKDDKHKAKWLDREDYRKATINNAINLYNNRRIETRQINPINTVINQKPKLELTDTGNAHRFAQQFGDIFKFNVDNKTWMFYNGKYWQDDVYSSVKNYAELIAEQLLAEANLEDNLERKTNMIKNVSKIYNRAGKDSMLKEAEHVEGIPCQNSNFDVDGYKLGCKDCVVDLKTKDKIEFDKSLMMSQTTGIDVSFEKPQRFLKFLDEIFEGNQPLIDFMQKAFGYSLTNSTKEQCMFILYGDGRNGKSLLLEIIRQALGAYAISAKSALLTETKTNESSIDDMARLKGKRMILVSETEIGDKLKESLIKTLTSGIDEIVARRLYGNSFAFLMTGKIFMSTNHLPIVRGNDLGIWRRLRVIPFTKIFVEGVNDDKNLKSKLEQELPEILGWLIEGCVKWQNEGLVVPNCIETITKEYRAEMDIVQRWINERCDVGLGPDCFESGTKLFEDFIEYSQANKEYIMSNTLFGRNLVKKFERKRIGSGNIYIGIKLKHKMKYGDI